MASTGKTWLSIGPMKLGEKEGPPTKDLVLIRRPRKYRIICWCT